MNPFDMRGPPFLAFYLLVSMLGMLYLYLNSRGHFETEATPSPDARRHLRDPYLLAYLRGGVREMLQTVVFSLNERKLLNSSGTELLAARSQQVLEAVQNPAELAVLSKCATRHTIEDLVSCSRLKQALEKYVEPLRHVGLIADDVEFERRRPAVIAVAGALFALGAIKIYVAIQRGHFNVGFLVMLTLSVLPIAYAIYKRRRTRAGGSRAQ